MQIRFGNLLIPILFKLFVYKYLSITPNGMRDLNLFKDGFIEEKT